MIPKTADGRVLFAIPWHGALLVGTTDVPSMRTPPNRARCLKKNNFCATTSPATLAAPRALKIFSVFGPGCVRWCAREAPTRRSSRVITRFSFQPSGLITVTGGKWTTYRRMGQDAIDRVEQVAGFPTRPSKTIELKLHGWTLDTSGALTPWDAVYGSDLPALAALSGEERALDAFLHRRLPFRRREVIWAVRHELARTIEDVLARRTRALFLDARAAIEAAPVVAALMARELGRNDAWKENEIQRFQEIANGYLYTG